MQKRFPSHLFLFLLLCTFPLVAQVAPQHTDKLLASVKAPAGFVATPAPQSLASVSNEVSSATIAQVAAFKSAAGANWSFYVDRRSGAMSLVEGQGIPWVAGDGRETIQTLEQKARTLMAQYPALFNVPLSELTLDTRGSSNYGETKQYWSIVFRQEINGTPVEQSRVAFHVAHGNLVQFGGGRVIPASMPASVRAKAPVLSAADARGKLAQYIGGLLADDRIDEDGTLAWHLRGADEVGAYAGAIGAGWEPQLAYKFIFHRAGGIATWEVLVSATTGTVLRFVDHNQYADALVKAGVYTLTNCTDQVKCHSVPGNPSFPGSAAEVGVTMPFTNLIFTGGTCAGDNCFSNSAGAFNYPTGAVGVATTLNGKYFQSADGCGATSVFVARPGTLDLGTSNPAPFPSNSDCAPATRQSPPNSGPVNGGAGDTHSARNAFFHMNNIASKGRFYLPENDWLKGLDGTKGQVVIGTNVAQFCNAFWQGSTNSAVFFKADLANFCNNTGEILGVFLHEWGHGLDGNDGTGRAPESATGEAMGDTFSLLETQDSCVGSNFRLVDPTDPEWGHTAGYGSTRARRCSGVRDLDYTKFCRVTGTPGNLNRPVPCAAVTDPDTFNGSRSSETYTIASDPGVDLGTPARWNHMLVNNLIADGQSNYWACGGPETTGCAGPLGHGCHCESLIPSQANWDLAKKLIQTEFGGTAYRAGGAGPLEVSAWQYMDRLWYLTRDTAVSGYSATGPFPAGTTNGCTESDWFSRYRVIDDDDGNLANGTPHADIIFSAFDLHAIACGNAGDASNMRSGNVPPPPAPLLSVCEAKSPVQLDWSDSPSVTQYNVLRNNLGCTFGFKPIATVPGNQSYFEDPDVAPGVTYFYSVQPIGEDQSAYGFASNCVAVTPTTCAMQAIAPPSSVSTSASADNQITVTWATVPTAGSYKILRKNGDCASTDAYVAVGVVLAPATSFVDVNGIEGSFSYSYVIVSSDTSCAACTSVQSTCSTVVATGRCNLAPAFDGVESVVAGAAGTCKLTVNWSNGDATCGTSLRYNIYRSTDPNFIPSTANLLVGEIAGTTYEDTFVTGGVRYHYIVRAVDAFGNIDANMIRRSEVPVGSLTAGTFLDDAGDTADGAQKFFPPSGTLTSAPQWVIRATGPGNATKHYATTASGDYPANSCEPLESGTIFLGTSPTLSFTSNYSMEPGWDGGIVEVATEAGGFSNWTKLTTVNYPSVMGGPLGDPACGVPGFADGQAAFTGTSAPPTAWTTHSGSLSAFSGARIRLRFLFGSDPSTNDLGWFIDNIRITNAQLPGACAGIAAVATQLEVDPTVLGTSNGNFILEPGEIVDAGGLWRNVSGSTKTMSGTASNFSGPAGFTYSLADSVASYGSVPDLATTNCLNVPDCYALSLSTGTRASTHIDASLDEALTASGVTGALNTQWSVHVGASFTDVATSFVLYRDIETLVHNSVTLGCDVGLFCPNGVTTRVAMAAFLSRAMLGGDAAVPVSGTVPNRGAYSCTTGGTSLFTDVAPENQFCRHIHYIASQNVTQGCTGTTFCPSGNVTRRQMAIFISRVLVAPDGDSAVPTSIQTDPDTGLNAFGYPRSYSCGGSGSGAFTDVPLNDPNCKQIYYIWSRGLVDGFADNTYGPSLTITRAQMSKFLVRTFDLKLD